MKYSARDPDSLLRSTDSVVERSTALDIRALGWAVAVHNDYRLHGEHHTFWLFTKDDRCVKGEGRSDAEALDAIRAQLRGPPRKSGASLHCPEHGGTGFSNDCIECRDFEARR